MSPLSKRAVKDLLGEIPLTAELYWQVRQGGKPLNKSFSLRRVEQHLPEWLAQVQAARQQRDHQPQALPTRRIALFATLRYWVEHSTLLGLTLAGLGHEATLTYLPYANWQQDLNRFDIRRWNAYARGVLSQAAPYLPSISLLDVRTVDQALPEALEQEVWQVSLRDVQYSLQVEEVDTEDPGSPSGKLFALRLNRNRQAAAAASTWMQANRPGVLLLPNGSILEMGAIYAAARSLGIPAVTYEFGEQRGRIWFAQNREVMRQETDELWAARGDRPLNGAQWEQMHSLFSARQQASLWENFARRWQGQPSQGGEQARQALGLDERPVVLLAANVIGDSLTLGRQVFSQSMTEWLERTARYFAARPQAQLVIRIHPGERFTKGPSIADVVRRALPELGSPACAHIHLVEASDPTNTYDLIEIADLGLVYTTTTGMEMAMSGTPVIVAGQTHYRGKGFTFDPPSWEDYFELLTSSIQDPSARRLSRAQVECAWRYAYRFFFEYPYPFPWHLVHFWDELNAWPLERVLSAEGQERFGSAFRCLAGEPRDWSVVPFQGEG